MKKYITPLFLALCTLVTTSSHAEFSLHRGFDKTCESGATWVLGSLGLYCATKGLTIAQEHCRSFQELYEGRHIGSNFATRFLYEQLPAPEPKQARTHILCSLASFALLAVMCIGNSINTNTP